MGEQIDKLNLTERVEIMISYLLRIGVILSVVIVAIGFALMLMHHPEYRTQRMKTSEMVSAMDEFPHTLGQVIDGVGHGQGRAIVVLGLFVLIATPVMRVAASIVAFAYQRDKRFVWITSIVLALLLLSFFLGRAGE